MDKKIKCLRNGCDYEGTDEEFQEGACKFFKLYHSRACPICGTTNTSYEGPEWWKKEIQLDNPNDRIATLRALVEKRKDSRKAVTEQDEPFAHGERTAYGHVLDMIDELFNLKGK
jgi:hypothetical protein